ncbi:M16 family metallopeptidase [Paludibacterium paludis]|uniref:Peptidase M16 n=1 Tax=Paludibacterium paludis TaxID=1225769 RepID=A0A918P7R9_9NEIS|nr:pitrilysin family protein [Paludibacterium paludis]GGY29843.1 peptidase M16 [Paludibacterium paludis]
MRFTPLCLALVFALGALPAAQAADSVPSTATIPAGATRIVSIEGITEYRLPNGLKVLLAPDASKPATTVNITYLVGSRMENYGETGMAHLLEHLLFKGTPAMPGKTLVEELSRRGMSFNGATSFDRTNYYETFAADDANLDWALRMEADRMVNSFIARKDLDTEFSVVRNEMEANENNPMTILTQKMASSAYQWHNYGKSPIGARSDVENVDIRRLQGFYHKYYQPDNAVLTVTGKFDEQKTLSAIVRYFGAIQPLLRLIEPSYTREPVQDGPRQVILERVGDTPIVAAMYHIAPGAHADAGYLGLLAQILGDEPNGRLYKALVEGKKAAAAGANLLNLKDPGSVYFLAVLNKQQSLPAARAALLATLEQIGKRPITEGELGRAKLAILNSYDKIMTDPTRFGIALSESIAKGDWRLFFWQRDVIEKATLADVNRVARQYLKESNRTLGEFQPTAKPDRADIPDTPDVTKSLENYKGRAPEASGEAFDASSANIEARTRRLTLANGMQLALLPKSTRGKTVRGDLVLHMGDEKSLFGRSQIAGVTAAMLLRGTESMTRSQIDDRLQALKASLSVGGGASAVNVHFETRREHLPELLTLINDILRRPTFPAAELSSLVTESLTGIDAARTEPQSLASQAMARHGNPYPRGDVRYAPTFDESAAELKSVKTGDLKAFHQRFYGTQNAQLSLVGDFDATAVEKQLRSLFGTWKAPASFTRIVQPFVPEKPDTLTLATPDKANAVWLASLAFPLRDSAADFPALLLATEILGGGSLKNRLIDRLRQKEGISYGAGASVSAASLDDNGGIEFYAIYAPQNRARLEAAVKEELERFVRDGVTDEELAAAKSSILKSRALARAQDGALASLLVSQLYLKRTMAFSEQREAQISAATRNEVNAAIRKYLVPASLVNIYAGDFAKASPAK